MRRDPGRAGIHPSQGVGVCRCVLQLHRGLCVSLSGRPRHGDVNRAARPHRLYAAIVGSSPRGTEDVSTRPSRALRLGSLPVISFALFPVLIFLLAVDLITLRRRLSGRRWNARRTDLTNGLRAGAGFGISFARREGARPHEFAGQSSGTGRHDTLTVAGSYF